MRCCSSRTTHRAPRLWERPLRGFFGLFNRGFDAVARGYGWLSVRVVRFAALMLVVYAGILAFGLNEFRKTPVGFIPALDRGFLIIVTQLPGGASLARTDEVNRRAVDIALKVPGVSSAVNVVGFSGATFTNAPNAGAVFAVLEPFGERAEGPAQVGRRDHRRAVQAPGRNPGGHDLRGGAAAGARHRQRRRLPHDDRGPRRPRRRRRCRRPSPR